MNKNYKHAEKLDKKNGNTKWMDLNKLENKQLDDYDIFIDKGKFAGCRIPRGFRLIRVHTIFKSSVFTRTADMCINRLIRWYGALGNR